VAATVEVQARLGKALGLRATNTIRPEGATPRLHV